MDVWTIATRDLGLSGPWLATGALVLARLVPIVVLAPFLGGRKLPVRVRLSVALALTVTLVPNVAPTTWGAPLDFVLALTTQVALGALFGIVAAITFQGVLIAGALVDVVRGSQDLGHVVAQTGESTGPLGDAKLQLAIAVFLLGGGHLVFLEAVGDSFATVPLAAPVLAGRNLELLSLVAEFSGDLLEIGLRLAAPALLATLFVDVCLGIVNRFAPQIPVLFLAMPLRAVLATAALALAVPTIVAAIEGEFAEMLERLRDVAFFLGEF